MDQLKNQLSNLKISYENTDNRRELVSLLEDALSQKIENTENQILSTDMLDSNEEIRLGTKGKSKIWKKREVVKELVKYIIVLLEGYFLAGNLNKSDRYSVQEMWNELTKLAEKEHYSVSLKKKIPDRFWMYLYRYWFKNLIYDYYLVQRVKMYIHLVDLDEYHGGLGKGHDGGSDEEKNVFIGWNHDLKEKSVNINSNMC
ncbi:hypothetical protein GLOIN_2v1812351 [Rhizophagus irregularis DAOM 181602=DAOM 197198]|uniref:Uncharacterized protein n=1 Tax=Rhizophagus irregularis (strain DAOM 181602 / DAOM 197198 / MUCL 43194) TaxID=747089 RepID=A0A2P4QLJ7_RHIID|nr:hypothetical protein GLOIN_2v1812351 [Rhizophagus irregularis DAOM 181602=DAOM 197198]POG78478.1 hypothetical protein GLOIN_2v1812351 [Rhizophagus irregularis DAOM 181602=DAOM 197198]|eukprot:XP_025185344.1 hypothetical protein GLOIN_2v1812351 [Rhizophagus irregularis DAOM 181602=DAOM 197198]